MQKYKKTYVELEEWLIEFLSTLVKGRFSSVCCSPPKNWKGTPVPIVWKVGMGPDIFWKFSRWDKIGFYRELNYYIRTRSLLTMRFVMVGYIQHIINLQFEIRARNDTKIWYG
jgi:hypothetical protein